MNRVSSFVTKGLVACCLTGVWLRPGALFAGEAEAGVSEAAGRVVALEAEVATLRAELKSIRAAVGKDGGPEEDHLKRMERVNLNMTGELNEQLKNADRMRERIRTLEARVESLAEAETRAKKADDALRFSQMEAEGLQGGLQRLQGERAEVSAELESLKRHWAAVPEKTQQAAKEKSEALVAQAAQSAAEEKKYAAARTVDLTPPRAEVLESVEEESAAPVIAGEVLCTVPCAGSDEVVAEAFDAAVARVREFLAEHPSGSLHVVGYWPGDGESSGVPLQRARRVADYLKRRGVPAERLLVAAGPAAGAGADPARRRVEILSN